MQVSGVGQGSASAYLILHSNLKGAVFKVRSALDAPKTSLGTSLSACSQGSLHVSTRTRALWAAQAAQ